ncbi:polysaccharide deacetylase family protein [Pseudomaricurvus sp. HS19]|nr:polysaccharide deacetylase family protein [Pseudomaricurvus sp. HS19]
MHRFLRKLGGLVARPDSLRILIYHRVLDSVDYLRPDEPDRARFNWQMKLLHDYFTPLGLAEALQLREEGRLPRNAVCVTFDDGYADNYKNALPILERWDIPASVFVSTGFLNGGRMWNDSVIESVRNSRLERWDLSRIGLGHCSLAGRADRYQLVLAILQAIKHWEPAKRAEAVSYIESLSEELPTDLMMTDSQVQEMARRGVTIGAHTVNHPILKAVDLDTATHEIRESREYLARLIGKEIPFFAYPNGRRGHDYEESHTRLIRDLGFSAALSTDKGVVVSNSDDMQLPRFTPWDKNPLKFSLRLLANR